MLFKDEMSAKKHEPVGKSFDATLGVTVCSSPTASMLHLLLHSLPSPPPLLMVLPLNVLKVSESATMNHRRSTVQSDKD